MQGGDLTATQRLDSLNFTPDSSFLIYRSLQGAVFSQLWIASLPFCQSPEPPELSMLHEELAASAASVAQEFPNGTVPPERTMPACSANAKLLEPRCLCLLTKGVGSQ